MAKTARKLQNQYFGGKTEKKTWGKNQFALHPGVTYKSFSYKKACNIILQSSYNHEKITLLYEYIFVFIWYVIGDDLPKNVTKERMKEF